MSDEFKITVLVSGLLLFTLLIPGVSHAGPLISAPEELAVIIREGLENNQDLQSMASSVRSLKQKAGAAGALNDPRIGIAVANLPTDSFRFDEQPMTQKQLFIAQKIPWFGKLGLKSQQVLSMALRQEAVLSAKQLALAVKIADAYYRLGYVAYSLEVNRKLVGMMKQILRIAETRYSSGRGLQQDIFQAQVEISRLLDEQNLLENKKRIIEDNIHELLNRKRFESIQPCRITTGFGPDLDLPALKARALKQNPRLKVREVEMDQAKIGVELADKEYWPDVDVKVTYGQRDEDLTGHDLTDFLSASMTMNVPLWQNNRQDKNKASNAASHDAAVKAYKHLVDSLPHMVDALATEIVGLQKSYKLYVGTLIPQTRAWAGSSMDSYEVGKMEFNTMMTAQIRLLRSELKAEDYRYQIHRKLAELEQLCGGPLTGATPETSPQPSEGNMP